MKKIILIISLAIGPFSYGHQTEKVSTIDFVQIVNNHVDEALFFYQNNWKVLRAIAVERGYIESYQILENKSKEGEPFDLMLITTYPNNIQFDERETNFQEIINEQSGLKLMNDKKPDEFRKTVYRKIMTENH